MTAYTGQTQTTLGQLCSRPMGLPVTAGCDTAWIVIQVVCSDASSTEMQYLRPLRHLGAPSLNTYVNVIVFIF
jgi:hypothetical protein